jgi:hypothetical protein
VILEGEIEKHLKEQVENEIAIVGKSIPLMKAVKALTINETKPNSLKITKKVFNEIKTNLNAKKIDLNKINLDKIIKGYFSETPPFGKGKKKAEFPDAFAIDLLRPYFKKNLYVISGDNDFHNFFDTHDEVMQYRSIKDFSIFYNEKTEIVILKKVVAFVKKEMKKIKEYATQLENEYSDPEYFEASEHHIHIEGAIVSDCKYESYHLGYVDHELNKAYVYIYYNAFVDISFSAEIGDYDYDYNGFTDLVGSNVSDELLIEIELVLNFNEKFSKIIDYEINSSEMGVTNINITEDDYMPY